MLWYLEVVKVSFLKNITEKEEVMRNISISVCLLVFLCSCAKVPVPQQLTVPIVVQEGNFTYSLFCEKKEFPGKFFVLPILEEQKLGFDIKRLFFRVEVKKQTTQKIIIKGFLRSQKVNGEKKFGDISGFRLVTVDLDLPTRDIIGQTIVAWFIIKDETGPIFWSKKVKYTIGGVK